MMHSDASPKSPRAELWQEVCEVADWRSLGSPEDRAKLRTLASGARWEDLVPAESRARRAKVSKWSGAKRKAPGPPGAGGGGGAGDPYGRAYGQPAKRGRPRGSYKKRGSSSGGGA